MKKISSILTIIIALSLILCGCSSGNGHNDDTSTNTENTTDPSAVVLDDTVYRWSLTSKNKIMISVDKIIHILDKNDENAKPECFCRVSGCDHTDSECTAHIGLLYPIIIDSGETSVMYWTHRPIRTQIEDQERLAEMEDVLGSAIRYAGAMYKYDLNTGERSLVAELLPFVDNPDFYYNGKIYMDASLDDIRTHNTGVTEKQYKTVFCIDAATGDYSYLDIGRNAVPIGIYGEKLYFSDAETYYDMTSEKEVTITDGKIYAASLDLSEYEIYTEIDFSYDKSFSSDGIFYFHDTDTSSVFALDMSKGETELKKITEKTGFVSIYSTDGNLYWCEKDKRTITYGDREYTIGSKNIIYCYDSKTGETKEISGKDLKYDYSAIEYADEDEIVFFGYYYGDFEKTGNLVKGYWQYSFETNEIKELYVYE